MTNSTPVPPSAAEADMAEHARALALIEQGRATEARDLLEQLAERGSRCWEVYNDLGAMAISQDDTTQALGYFQRAAEVEPTPGKARINLATLRVALGEFEAALNALSPLLRHDPNHADGLHLVHEILVATPALSPVAWVRLLNDLRAPSAEQRAMPERVAMLEQRNAELEINNRRLVAQIELLTEELHGDSALERSARGQESWHMIRDLSDQEWQQALIRSVRIPSFKGFPMPLFPDTGLQEGMVGSSNEGAIIEGMRFYKAVKAACSDHGVKLGADRKLLDFGTGWGRYARIFLKDYRPENITGVDVDESFVALCREMFPYGRFETVPAFPPTSLEAVSFQLVVAYSVFSHLSQAAADAWIAEFARLVEPGGVVAITTQGRTFLEVCERMRGRESFDHPWHQNLARSFVDREACERAYDAGEFLFSPTGGGAARSSDFYGEALVPPGYVERHWTRDFELLEYIDDRGYLPQALIVLRRRA